MTDLEYQRLKLLHSEAKQIKAQIHYCELKIRLYTNKFRDAKDESIKEFCMSSIYNFEALKDDYKIKFTKLKTEI